MLRIKLSTVRSLVRRARTFLRRRLADYMSASLDVAADTCSDGLS